MDPSSGLRETISSFDRFLLPQSFESLTVDLSLVLDGLTELTTPSTSFSSSEINSGLSGLVVDETMGIVLGGATLSITFLVLGIEEEMVLSFCL